MHTVATMGRRFRWRLFQDNYALPEVGLDSYASRRYNAAPPVTEGLFLPPYAGPATVDDVSPLLSLVLARQPRLVLEFGTAYGATAANICAITDASVYTVNALPEQMAGKLTTVSLNSDEIGWVYRSHGYADRVTQIYANTREIELDAWLEPQSIDFAIIDACHDADFVLSDFLTVLPYVSEKGLVLLHDVHPSLDDHLVDSYVACMYLRRLGFDVRHLAGTWWGVWSAASARIRHTASARTFNEVDRAVLKLIDNDDRYRDVLRLRYYARQQRDAKTDAVDQ